MALTRRIKQCVEGKGAVRDACDNECTWNGNCNPSDAQPSCHQCHDRDKDAESPSCCAARRRLPARLAAQCRCVADSTFLLDLMLLFSRISGEIQPQPQSGRCLDE